LAIPVDELTGTGEEYKFVADSAAAQKTTYNGTHLFPVQPATNLHRRGNRRRLTL
jgi:hypothetical protein